MKPVPCTWVFEIKLHDTEGKNLTEKTRCGFRSVQQNSYVIYDANNIYQPVASKDSIRILIPIVAGENLQLEGRTLVTHIFMVTSMFVSSWIS